jgi:transposase
MGEINVANDKITHITKSYEKINSNSIADFFGKIQQKLQNQDKIHIIMDNASYPQKQGNKSLLGNSQ